MEFSSTKEKIIYESLLLFAKDGFESTSTRAIARSINCSDAVIYKHFKSKQEILDAIVEKCTNRLLARSSEIKIESMCWKEVENICLSMFEFQTSDEWIVPFRRLVVIEQFKNPELKAIYRKVFVDGPIEAMAEMFKKLIELGFMKPGNPKVYAMDLYSPFFMYHTLGADSKELMDNLREHVTMFRKNVVTDSVYLTMDTKGI